MKNFIERMFSDKSDINAKTVVGVTSFVTMVLYGLTDVVTGALKKEFVIEPIVFNGLMYTTFACLGIAGAEAIFGNKNLPKQD
jgi:tetrahydromethanopterin S-methyltransferase subunit C